MVNATETGRCIQHRPVLLLWTLFASSAPDNERRLASVVCEALRPRLNYQPDSCALLIGDHYVYEGGYDHDVNTIGLEVIASYSNCLDCLIGSACAYSLHVGAPLVAYDCGNCTRDCAWARVGRYLEHLSVVVDDDLLCAFLQIVNCVVDGVHDVCASGMLPISLVVVSVPLSFLGSRASTPPERRLSPYAVQSPKLECINLDFEHGTLNLLSVFDGARLAHDRYLDLARILQTLLDAFGDIACQPHRAQVVYRLRLYQHSYFAPRLDCEAPLYSFEGVCYGLQSLQPLDVVLDAVAPGSRAAPGERVSRLHYPRLDCVRLLFVVVRGDGVDDLGRAAQTLGDLRADEGVRAFDLVVNGLADVVQEGGGLRYVCISPNLC